MLKRSSRLALLLAILCQNASFAAGFQDAHPIIFKCAKPIRLGWSALKNGGRKVKFVVEKGGEFGLYCRKKGYIDLAQLIVAGVSARYAAKP